MPFLTIDQYDPFPFLLYTMLLIAACTFLLWALVRRYWQHVEALVIAIPMLTIGLMSQVVQIR